MTTTASQLARAFGIVVRQIADLLTMLQDYNALAPSLPRILDISDQEAMNLQVCKSILWPLFEASVFEFYSEVVRLHVVNYIRLMSIYLPPAIGR